PGDVRLDLPWKADPDGRLRRLIIRARRPPADPYKGDVLSRMAIRIDEIDVSRSLVESLLELAAEAEAADEEEGPRRLTSGRLSAEPFTYQLGYAESFRGAVFHFVMLDADLRPFRVKIRDPSVPNWPVLADALSEQRVQLSDFPLINKSFNLSYAGNDL